MAVLAILRVLPARVQKLDPPMPGGTWDRIALGA
jgi:hypothetical protein